MQLNIIFQDDEIIVIDKPPGLVSTPSDTQNEPTLADILNSEYGVSLERGGLVHRLDKDTSGIILATKTLESFDALQSQFQSREVKKEYLALVHGFLDKRGIIQGNVGRNPGDREKFVVFEAGEDGKEASTEYETQQLLEMTDDSLHELFSGFNKIQMRKINSSHYREFSLVRCFPKTGRTHQIRVHLKHINHPIVGDEKYGGRKTVRLDHRWCKRQFLHAAKITFKHPKTQRLLEFESRLAPDLQEALQYLEAKE